MKRALLILVISLILSACGHQFKESIQDPDPSSAITDRLDNNE